MKAWLCAAALLVAGSCFADSARAHAIGLSHGTYRLTARGMSAELVFDRDEFGALGSARAQDLAARIHVSSRGERCRSTLTHTRRDTASTLTLFASFDCPVSAEPLAIQLSFWAELVEGHRHVVNAASGARSNRPLCFASDPGFELSPIVTGPPADATVSEASDSKATPASSWLGWVRYGVEHIWAGPDHLLFLLALVFGVSHFRALARITLTFTVAHTATLALAAAEIVTPPPSLIEPLIAVSIAIVAIENLLARRSRSLTVFAFGLIHGFGFAGALSEVGLAPWHDPGALIAFNLGVEFGQLILLGLALPLVARLRRHHWFSWRGLPCLNAALVLVSVSWFCARIENPTKVESFPDLRSPAPLGVVAPRQMLQAYMP